MDKWWRPISPFKLNWYIINFLKNKNIAWIFNLLVRRRQGGNVCLKMILVGWKSIRLYDPILAKKRSCVNVFDGIRPQKIESKLGRYFKSSLIRQFRGFHSLYWITMLGICLEYISNSWNFYINFSQALSRNINLNPARGVSKLNK